MLVAAGGRESQGALVAQARQLNNERITMLILQRVGWPITQERVLFAMRALGLGLSKANVHRCFKLCMSYLQSQPSGCLRGVVVGQAPAPALTMTLPQSSMVRPMSHVMDEGLELFDLILADMEAAEAAVEKRTTGLRELETSWVRDMHQLLQDGQSLAPAFGRERQRLVIARATDVDLHGGYAGRGRDVRFNNALDTGVRVPLDALLPSLTVTTNELLLSIANVMHMHLERLTARRRAHVVAVYGLIDWEASFDAAAAGDEFGACALAVDDTLKREHAHRTFVQLHFARACYSLVSMQAALSRPGASKLRLSACLLPPDRVDAIAASVEHAMNVSREVLLTAGEVATKDVPDDDLAAFASVYGVQMPQAFMSLLATDAMQDRIYTWRETHHASRYKYPVMSCEFGLQNGAQNLPFNLLTVESPGCAQRAASLEDLCNRTSTQRFLKPNLPYRDGVERAVAGCTLNAPRSLRVQVAQEGLRCPVGRRHDAHRVH